jgi:hydroxymethylglutaryl-CoA synthase
MTENNVGIGDMAMYLPDLQIQLADILQMRAAQDPSFERRLRRAIESTGQEAMRFTQPWEDPVTMAAEAIGTMFNRGAAGRETGSTLAEQVRYIATGTETSVDMSKPISAFAQGLLQRGGHNVPKSLSTFQIQHACAGGTIALTSIAALLQAAAKPEEKGVVVCTDVARYETPSTAEVTQGAGAVAMLLEQNPRLLNLELNTIGLFSSDVDDFFRPLGSITARVKGRYSVDCYNEALETAYLDHCTRRGTSPEDTLQEADMIIVHVPFHRMAVTGTMRLVERQLHLDPAGAQEFLDKRRFGEGIEATRIVGNTYSASAFMSLMWNLYNRYQAVGDAIVGQRFMLASYGSGNTMTVVSGTVAPGAPAVIDTWNLPEQLKAYQAATWEQYEHFIAQREYSLATGMQTHPEAVPGGRYYFAGIREDGYRQYEYAST